MLIEDENQPQGLKYYTILVSESEKNTLISELRMRLDEIITIEAMDDDKQSITDKENIIKEKKDVEMLLQKLGD